jgi:hypothetical protein
MHCSIGADDGESGRVDSPFLEKHIYIMWRVETTALFTRRLKKHFARIIMAALGIMHHHGVIQCAP